MKSLPEIVQANAALEELDLCKVCHTPGQVVRHVELELGDIGIDIRAPLCNPCVEALPYRCLEALQSPLVRAILKTLGVTFDLEEAGHALGKGLDRSRR